MLPLSAGSTPLGISINGSIVGNGSMVHKDTISSFTQTQAPNKSDMEDVILGFLRMTCLLDIYPF